MPAGVRNWKSFVENSTVLQIHTHTCKTHKQGKTGLRQRGWSGEKGRNGEVSKVRMGDHDMSLVSSMSFDLFSFCSLYFFLNYKKIACTERRSIWISIQWSYCTSCYKPQLQLKNRNIMHMIMWFEWIFFLKRSVIWDDPCLTSADLFKTVKSYHRKKCHFCNVLHYENTVTMDWHNLNALESTQIYYKRHQNLPRSVEQNIKYSCKMKVVSFKSLSVALLPENISLRKRVRHDTQNTTSHFFCFFFFPSTRCGGGSKISY